MRRKSSIFRVCMLFVVVCFTSCDRAKKLQEERQRVEKDAEHIQAETQALEQRILSLGSYTAAATVTIERQAAALEQKAAGVQREIDSMKAKLTALESAAATFSPKVDSYKAKHLR